MRTATALAIGFALAAAVGCADSDVSRALGARCEATGECDDRCLLPSNEYPDGFCTLDCDTSSDCPSNSECIDRDGGVCLFSCFDDATCAFLGLGWRCQEDGLHAFPDSKVKICRGG